MLVTFPLTGVGARQSVVDRCIVHRSAPCASSTMAACTSDRPSPPRSSASGPASAAVATRGERLQAIGRAHQHLERSRCVESRGHAARQRRAARAPWRARRSTSAVGEHRGIGRPQRSRRCRCRSVSKLDRRRRNSAALDARRAALARADRRRSCAVVFEPRRQARALVTELAEPAERLLHLFERAPAIRVLRQADLRAGAGRSRARCRPGVRSSCASTCRMSLISTDMPMPLAPCRPRAGSGVATAERRPMQARERAGRAYHSAWPDGRGTGLKLVGATPDARWKVDLTRTAEAHPSRRRLSRRARDLGAVSAIAADTSRSPPTNGLEARRIARIATIPISSCSISSFRGSRVRGGGAAARVGGDVAASR